jgi:hypothetical protein
VGIDTTAFIYFIEAHPTYLPPLRPLFPAADLEAVTVVASAVMLLEVPGRAESRRNPAACPMLRSGS